MQEIAVIGAVDLFGNLYRDQGKLKEANEMLQQALAGYRKVLGADHQKTQLVAERLRSLVKLSKLTNGTLIENSCLLIYILGYFQEGTSVCLTNK